MCILHFFRLLIWEEYCYESTLSGLQNPELPFREWGECCGSDTSSQLVCQPWDKVGLLINKMMNNRIVIVGQGFTSLHFPICRLIYYIKASFLVLCNSVRHFLLFFFRLVGRAAFTGKHQWILANSYMTDSQPAEVLQI